MSKFLFVVPPFFGHISPTLSVGAALLSKGHEVVWVGIRPIADEHVPAGGRFLVPHQELAEHEDEIKRILKRQDDGPHISAVEALKLGLEETYLPFCRFIMKGLSRIVDEFQPDLIINDCITFAGALCAHLKGIPCVTTTPVPPDLIGESMAMPKIAEWQHNLIMGLQKEFGIYTDEYVIHSHKMNIIFTSKEFARTKNPPEMMKFVGPVKGRPNYTPFDWNRLERSTYPKVFVSIGTLLVDIRKEFFSKIVEAFADQPITIVAATNPDIFETWPDNFIVQSFVPQSEVMAKMDAVICHGGFNTVNDTFWNGLPMLILPIAYDQFHTAALIEAAGCGLKLRYKRLRVSELRSTMFEVLENPKYRKAAQAVKDTFVNAGGVDKAVSHLEEMALSGDVTEKAAW